MSRTPDYRVGILNKATDNKNNRAGGAWINKDGSISIVLDPFISITQSNRDVLITLFPNNEKVSPDA